MSIQIGNTTAREPAKELIAPSIKGGSEDGIPNISKRALGLVELLIHKNSKEGIKGGIPNNFKVAFCLVQSSVLLNMTLEMGIDKDSILASAKVLKMASKVVAPTILLEPLEPKSKR